MHWLQVHYLYDPYLHILLKHQLTLIAKIMNLLFDAKQAFVKT